MFDDFTIETFANRAGQKFRIHLVEQDNLDLELTEVEPMRRPRSTSDDTPPPAGTPLPAGAGDSFSLTFRGPRDRYAPQATYLFDHEEIGQFPLFIVPIGGDEHAFYYQAIFNRRPR